VEKLKVRPSQKAQAGEFVALVGQDDLTARLRQRPLDFADMREQRSLLVAFHKADAEERSKPIQVQKETRKHAFQCWWSLQRRSASRPKSSERFSGRASRCRTRSLLPVPA
jgi:hypothetical protein